MTDKFRRNLSRQPPVEITVVNEIPPTPKRTVAFEWARIFGAVAQILMLLVVVGGYYFTIRPHFKTQLLEERAASLALLVNEKEAELKKVEPSIKAAEDRVRELEQQRATMVSGLEEMEGRLEQKTVELENILWRRFLFVVDMESEFDGLVYTLFRDPNDWDSIEPFGYKQTSELDPMQQLLIALDSIQMEKQEDQRTARFIKYARKEILSRRQNLQCESLDVPAMEIEHGKEFEAIKTRFYRSGEQAELSRAAEVKRQAEIRIEEIDAKSALRRRYSVAIRAIVGKCEDRRRRVIDAMGDLPAPLPQPRG